MNAAVLGWAERRRFVRIPLSERFGAVTLEPRGQREAAAQVLDFSPGGVSLEPGSAEWLQEDMPLSLRVGVREFSCSLAPESSEGLCLRKKSSAPIRLALDFDRDEQEDIARLYHRLRFPSLRRRAFAAEGELRALLAESGHPELRPGFELDAAWLRADWPTTLSHEVVFREAGGQCVGHLAVTRAYRNSWIGHEIALLPQAGDRRCQRDLFQHLCVWPRLMDGDGTYVFAHYSPKRRSERQVFEAFASRSAADECVVVRSEQYLPDPSSAPRRQDVAEFTLDPLESHDEAQVLDMIEQSWPALARAAFDIGPGSLSRECLHPAFAALGGQRARRCLVLRSGQRLIATLLCEWQDRGPYSFDALSLAHVFLAAGIEPSSRIEHAITSVLYDFYHARGLKVPRFTCPPGTFHRRDVPGFEWVETMGLIVFSARALRAFENYIEMLEPDAGSLQQR